MRKCFIISIYCITLGLLKQTHTCGACDWDHYSLDRDRQEALTTSWTAKSRIPNKLYVITCVLIFLAHLLAWQQCVAMAIELLDSTVQIPNTL